MRDGLEVLSDYMEARMKANEPIDFEKVNLKGVWFSWLNRSIYFFN